MRCNPETTPPWEPIAAALTRGPEMDPRSRSRLVERTAVGEGGEIGVDGRKMESHWWISFDLLSPLTANLISHGAEEQTGDFFVSGRPSPADSFIVISIPLIP